MCPSQANLPLKGQRIREIQPADFSDLASGNPLLLTESLLALDGLGAALLAKQRQERGQDPPPLSAPVPWIRTSGPGVS